MTEKYKRTLINAVLMVETISFPAANMIRVEFISDKPLTINPLWVGPHVKLLFPSEPTCEFHFPTFNEENKIIWQEGQRKQVRTYSVRAYDEQQNRLTIDFVKHHHGTASNWINQAKVGQQIGLVGLGAKCQFNERELLFIGDITAVPAISYSLSHLPKEGRAHAIIQVNDPLEIDNHLNTNHSIHWLINDENQPSQLVDCVAQYLSTHSGETLLIWGGMESSLAQQIRHLIKQDYPQLSTSCQLVSYWRQGFAEGEFKHRE